MTTATTDTPKTICCPLCDHKGIEVGDDQWKWLSMLNHIWYTHPGIIEMLPPVPDGRYRCPCGYEGPWSLIAAHLSVQRDLRGHLMLGVLGQ